MTQYYVGVKIVKAWPEIKDGKEGYTVKYPDGYQSWCPKDVFEAAYFPMGATNDNTVTQEMVEGFLTNVSATSLTDGKTTLVKGEMATGFVEYFPTSCVDPRNYSEEIGKYIGTKRILDGIWKMLGFVVQWGKFGLTKKAGA